jgi:hypothetical protein
VAAPSGGEAAPSGGEAAPSPDGLTPKAPGTPDWAALGSVEDLDHIEIPPEVPPVVKPPVVPKAPPVAPTQQVAPKAEPAAPITPVVEGGEAAAPPLSASDPMGIAAGLEANRDAVLAHLAQTKFALTEADVQELETDVVSAVPKIMSRIFFESQVSMQKFLAQAVPGMVRQYNTVNRANEDAEQMFFSAHKALDVNNPTHRATAVRIASIYRQANPDIPLQQLIAEVGPMVTAALKLNGHAPTPGRSVAAAPQMPRGGTPFRPAVGGSGGAPTPEPVNEWAGLGQTFD